METKEKAQEEEGQDGEPEEDLAEEDLVPPPIILEEEMGWAGQKAGVYWPPGMEEWLRLKEKDVKKRNAAAMVSIAEKATVRRADK